MKKGRSRDRWDLPQGNSKGMAKWGLGPRGLTAQTEVLVLRPGIFQVHSILPPGPSVSFPSGRWGPGWGCGPQSSTMAGWFLPRHRLRPRRGYFPVLHAVGHHGARGLPPHPLSPLSDNDPGVQKDLLPTINNILPPNNCNSSQAIYTPIANMHVRRCGWRGACVLFSSMLCP